ncbi:GAF domain-containing protein [Deinococcus sp. QL22]|uniref:GAF domain-containing protein n=1 Tax=Deinococcus sp. QL22 TaxID=2939437 RepID=UPI002016EC74|nr:GAF domain-containing protein [Deinococcus sp. QL22]UQN09191.1 GAF domain-containing protein [Deinococcus sp. QL22]
MAHRWTNPSSPKEQRLDALHRYGLSYQSPERSFDLLAEGRAKLYRTSFALVTFMDATQQHVKAASGLEVRSIPLASSLCRHLLTSEGALVIGDTTQDQRATTQAVVTGLHQLRFYAGAPIRSADGFRIGSVCVLNTLPRDPETFDLSYLLHFAHLAEALLEHRLMGSTGELTFQSYQSRQTGEDKLGVTDPQEKRLIIDSQNLSATTGTVCEQTTEERRPVKDHL